MSAVTIFLGMSRFNSCSALNFPYHDEKSLVEIIVFGGSVVGMFGVILVVALVAEVTAVAFALEILTLSPGASIGFGCVLGSGII
jgi:hypothetical protein